MTKLVAFAGSTRRDSTNKKLVQVAARGAEAADSDAARLLHRLVGLVSRCPSGAPLPPFDAPPPASDEPPRGGAPSPLTPLGQKGAGEAGCSGALAAIMNAVVDALADYGVTNFDMPATPHRVWQAIHGNAG